MLIVAFLAIAKAGAVAIPVNPALKATELARILDALSFAYDNQDLIEADIAREQELFQAEGGPSVGARPSEARPPTNARVPERRRSPTLVRLRFV